MISTFKIVHSSGLGRRPEVEDLIQNRVATLVDDKKSDAQWRNALTLKGSSQLQVTANASCVTTDVGLPLGDVTDRCYFASNNSAMASVSSLTAQSLDDGSTASIPAKTSGYLDGGPAGAITWHPPLDGSALQPVSFTATLWSSTGGASVQSLSQPLTVSPPAGLKPVLSSVQLISTQNSVDTSLLLDGQYTKLDFYPTVFFQDGQLYAPYIAGLSKGQPSAFDQSVTLQFQLLTNDKTTVISSQTQGGGFIDTQEGRLPIDNKLPPGDYVVRMSLYGPSVLNNQIGEARIHVDGVL